MTNEPIIKFRSEAVKPLLAEYLLAIGAGFTIALVIHRIVKYPRHE